MAINQHQKNSGQEEVCCPEFEPSLWDEKILEWDKKRFVKSNICTLFYMPLNFGAVMRKLDAKIRASGAEMEKDGLGLSDHTSKWNMDIYLAVNKEVPGLTNVAMTGKFLCKVYEGAYKETGKWCKDYENYAKSRHVKIEKWYLWYTTCPKCAKKYGKNYVAIIGRIV